MLSAGAVGKGCVSSACPQPSGPYGHLDSCTYVAVEQLGSSLGFPVTEASPKNGEDAMKTTVSM